MSRRAGHRRTEIDGETADVGAAKNTEVERCDAGAEMMRTNSVNAYKSEIDRLTECKLPWLLESTSSRRDQTRYDRGNQERAY